MAQQLAKSKVERAVGTELSRNEPHKYPLRVLTIILAASVIIAMVFLYQLIGSPHQASNPIWISPVNVTITRSLDGSETFMHVELKVSGLHSVSDVLVRLVGNNSDNPSQDPIPSSQSLCPTHVSNLSACPVPPSGWYAVLVNSTSNSWEASYPMTSGGTEWFNGTTSVNSHSFIDILWRTSMINPTGLWVNGAMIST